MDENRSEYEGNALNKKHRISEDIHNTIFERKYAYLMEKWMGAFAEDGLVKGINGGAVIRGIINHYERKDTVSGYRRCFLMMKLLGEYDQRYPKHYS